MTKFDVIVDEGRDGWTLLAIKMEASTAGGGGEFKKTKQAKAPVFAPSCVTPVGLEGQKKHAGKCSPLNTCVEYRFEYYDISYRSFVS